jgi:flagellar motility protein MotE (MotC chaperone)
MNMLTKPWFAAVLIVLLQPAVSIFLVLQSAPAIVQSLSVRVREGAAEAMRPREVRAPWDMWTPEIEKLAKELRDQRDGLREREQAVVQRETRLEAEAAELARTRREIEAQRAEISNLLTAVGADEMKNLKSLAQTYSNLTPKAAVAIFAEMDDTTVVKILSLMKADVVGPIFEEMSKDKSERNNQAHRAATLSERLRLMKAKTSAGSP